MSKRHGKRGSSLPETVIVMIVLLTLTFGLMDFGRAIYTFAWMTDIAQRAHRWAIVRGSSCTKLDHCGINGSNNYPAVFVLGNDFGIVNPTSIGVSTNDDGVGVPNSPGSLLVSLRHLSVQLLVPVHAQHHDQPPGRFQRQNRQLTFVALAPPVERRTAKGPAETTPSYKASPETRQAGRGNRT